MFIFLLGFASRSQQNVILGSYVSLFCLVTVILFILVPAVNVSSLPGLSRTYFHFFVFSALRYVFHTSGVVSLSSARLRLVNCSLCLFTITYGRYLQYTVFI